jgi:Plant transposon protein
MEAICDYHLFFWHASYGYTGILNDRTILSLSPLLDRIIDSSFHQLEEEAGVVPFKILEEAFEQTWITVDGIYPKYIRFVKGMKQPVTQTERRYTQWQEATRKDNERVFGECHLNFSFEGLPNGPSTLRYIYRYYIYALGYIY